MMVRQRGHHKESSLSRREKRERRLIQFYDNKETFCFVDKYTYKREEEEATAAKLLIDFKEVLRASSHTHIRCAIFRLKKKMHNDFFFRVLRIRKIIK